MAGTKEQGSFREIVSPFLKSKIEVLKKSYGIDSKEYFAVASQYLKSKKKIIQVILKELVIKSLM